MIMSKMSPYGACIRLSVVLTVERSYITDLLVFMELTYLTQLYHSEFNSP